MESTIEHVPYSEKTRNYYRRGGYARNSLTCR